jgi:hypothetical protein
MDFSSPNLAVDEQVNSVGFLRGRGVSLSARCLHEEQRSALHPH